MSAGRLPLLDGHIQLWLAQSLKGGNALDQPLCSTASQSHDGCRIMGHHARQGGKSNDPEDTCMWDQHGKVWQ